MQDSESARPKGRTSPETALKKLKHFCGYQERCHADVKEKLYSLGLFKQEVESVISQLIEEGYLNEERFAIQFASGKSRIKNWGTQKIRYALRQKGVSDFCINKALKSLDGTDYINGFNRLALKKWTTLRSEKNIFAKKKKWQQFLLQRGFDLSMIKSWTLPSDVEPGTDPD